MRNSLNLLLESNTREKETLHCIGFFFIIWMFHHWHCFFKYILKNNFKRIYKNDEKLEWAKTMEKYKSLYNEEVENRTKNTIIEVK